MQTKEDVMQHTEHARIRMEQRQIDQRQLDLVLEHGEWNARGDRLTLGERSLRSIIADRRRSLRTIERGRCSHSIHASRLENGRD